jgi:hypothetical protein
LVNVSVETNLPVKGLYRRQTTATVTFPVFWTMADFEVQPLPLVLNDWAFKAQRLAVAHTDTRPKTKGLRVQRPLDGPLHGSLGIVSLIATSNSEEGGHSNCAESPRDS